MKICFPVKDNEGVKSIPFGHFGTAPMFVVFDNEKNEVSTINNGDLGHEHGSCNPMKALTGEAVDVVIVGGIGLGAVNKLKSLGIKVYRAQEGNIENNLQLFNNGKLDEFVSNNTCNHDGCNH
jgi:ArsR family transcriptional regulator